MVGDLGAHKSERAREPIEGRGCRLLFLPPLGLPRHHGRPNIEDERPSQRSFGRQGQHRIIHQSSREKPSIFTALRRSRSRWSRNSE